MSSNEVAGSFLALRGENCNFTNIGGIKSLRTENGIDLVALGSKIDSVITSFESKIKIFEQKIAELEKNGGGKAGPPGPAGPMGPSGKDGKDAKGAKGKSDKLGDIEDVDLSGLTDGSLLEWNASVKKWVVLNNE